MKKKAALYFRVSTDRQAVDLQVDEVRQYAKDRGFEIHREYTDQGVSGSKTSRPQLNRLFHDAKKGQFDLVICWKFDRFGRSLKHLIESLEEFQSLEVDFVSVRESIDTSTPSGKVLFSVIGAFAEFERAIIRERVIAGLTVARKKGKQLGRPKTRNSELIRELRQQGRSYREISKLLGCSISTIHHELKGSVRKLPKEPL